MFRTIFRIIILLGIISTFARMIPIRSAHAESEAPVRTYPADPTADTAASPSQFTSVANVQSAINAARAAENSQLGTSIRMLEMPEQETWDEMSDSERGLWLVNRERTDRMGAATIGLLPLQDIETNVTNVARNYANYLLTNNKWGHTVDGKDPWARMNSISAINSCHDFLSVGENLYVSVSTNNNRLTYQVEMAIYLWMYADSGSAWGHRHAILWYPYIDNNGSAGKEGFMGIGVAKGGPYQGPFSSSWPYASIVVMNMFDQCATWRSPTAFIPLVIAP